MPLILHNDTSPAKGEQGPQYGCCGKLFRDGPCDCKKPTDAEQIEEQRKTKAPEIRSAEALEAIRDTMLLIAERLNLPQHPRKSA